MRKLIFGTIGAALFLAVYAVAASASPDQYFGDTAIYGGSDAVLQPNILIIIDTSGSMGDGMASVGTYSASRTYLPINNVCKDGTGLDGTDCFTNSVYLVSQLSNSNTTYTPSGTLSTIPATCSFTSTTSPGNPTASYYTPLSTAGRVLNVPPLNPDGTCCFVTLPSGRTTACTKLLDDGHSYNKVNYNLGNYINAMYDNTIVAMRKIDIAKNVVANLVQATNGVKFGLMSYHYKASTSAKAGSCSPGGGGSGTLHPDTVCTSNPNMGAVGSAADAMGGQFLASVPTSSITTTYVTTIKYMNSIFDAGTGLTNRDALADTALTLDSMGYTPLGETLYEAMRYFQGGAPAFDSTIGVTGGHYTSPIDYACQKNYVIFVSDGEPTADDFKKPNGSNVADPNTAIANIIGTNPSANSLPSVAKWMYEHDMLTGATGTNSNNVSTYTIGFGITGTGQTLLNTTADSSHGRGTAYNANDAVTLSNALSEIIANIVSENSSFVAPVVPVNPTNRADLGNRVFMGFFRPEGTGFWSGNLKKFALSTDPTTSVTSIVDRHGDFATFVDSDSDKRDDRDGAVMSSKEFDGSIRSASTPSISAHSFWGADIADGGDVKSGGVGALLRSRNFYLYVNSSSKVTSDISGTNPRLIFSKIAASNNLTDDTNLFRTQNISNITASLLGLPGEIITTSTDTDIKKLINYVHGFDVYSTGTGSAPLQKRGWIFGDVLHSKPLVVSYATYSFSTANESDSAQNKTMIFVGTNDGMLHAINDWDGSEAWAFIPPDLLPRLQYLTGNVHTYFVDTTVTAYVFNKRGDGNIDTGNGDKVILVFGLRRGGGTDAEPSQGYYYAIDVSTPTAPVYMWKFSSATDSGVGETWSEPKIAKVKTGTTDKIAVFFGGGYDNCNEDYRYGNIQTFPTTSCVGLLVTADDDVVTSTGTNAVAAISSANYKGRALYVLDLGTITSTSFTPNSSPTILKTFSLPSFSIPSELLILDTDGNGYVDRIYTGDTGGNLWRFNISSTTTSDWTATKIFSSNPGSDGTNGRKIFYRPVGYVDNNFKVRLFFGTGDREHPLNRAVIDRMYEVIDKGQSSFITEGKLIDVTTDQIQTSTDMSGVNDMITKLNQADDPNDTTYYGWYIRLDGQDRSPTVAYPGEKVLAAPALVQGKLMMTTYSPIISAVTDTSTVCQGNLGMAALYLLDSDSGMAIANFDASNDTSSNLSSLSFNQFATPGGQEIFFITSEELTKATPVRADMATVQCL